VDDTGHMRQLIISEFSRETDKWVDQFELLEPKWQSVEQEIYQLDKQLNKRHRELMQQAFQLALEADLMQGVVW
jgi:hypothetical protein